MSDALCRLKANLPHQYLPDLFEVIKEYDYDIDRHMKTIHKKDDHLRTADKEIASLRAELAELRARVPAICFPRQPNGEGGWVIDANYVAAIHKDCFPIEWQPCEEEVEAVLLAVERAAPVTPAAVPDDVAKDAERYRWLKGNAEQGAVRTLLPLTRCHYVIVNESAYDHPTFDSAVDAAIEFAILAAKEKGQ